jgi:threonine efflux protein
VLTSLVAIAVLHWVVLVTPGANVLVVSQLAASGQRRAACFAALGVTVVAVVWAALAVLGVHAVFAAHPRLRALLQVAGGLYLCYVAVRLWRSGAPAKQVEQSELAPFAAFRLGFLTNILNPKSALFFGSVFATALPAEPSVALLAAAIAVVFVNALVWHLFLALAFSQPRVQAAYARQRKALNRIASALVGAFGIRLLLSTLAEARAAEFESKS